MKGADLMDGTPIYDIKPYVVYADCHPDARCGLWMIEMGKTGCGDTGRNEGISERTGADGW